MRRVTKEEVKVSIGAEALWKALAKDTLTTVPASVPNLVTSAQILQGDGGLGTIYHFQFGPDVTTMRYQKERISVYDESARRIGLEVIEGGRLELGFTFYMTTFGLTALGDSETLVEVGVHFETNRSESSSDNNQETVVNGIIAPPSATVKSGIAFIRSVEAFLMGS